MPRGKKIPLLAALLLAGMALPARANPVMVMFDLYGMANSFHLLLFVAISSLLVEYLAVRLLLNRWLDLWRLLPGFLLINLLTFPLTQLLGLFFSAFAEIVPLLLEPPMYRRLARQAGVTVPNVWARIVGANLISFGCGIAAYYPIAHLKGLL